MEQKGVKELTEVIELIEALALKIIPAVADGVQLHDIQVLLDQDLLDKAKKALEGLTEIDDEIKDLSWAEGAALSPRLFLMVQGVVAKLPKKAEE